MPIQSNKDFLPAVAGYRKPDLCDADRITLQDSLEIPGALQLAAAANPQLGRTMLHAVRAAVEESLAHPETRMRVLTGAELKRRGQICLAALTMMYCEQGLTLHQSYACLRDVLLSALMQDQRAADVAAATQRPGLFAVDKSTQLAELEPGDMNEGSKLPVRERRGEVEDFFAGEAGGADDPGTPVE